MNVAEVQMKYGLAIIMAEGFLESSYILDIINKFTASS